MVLSHYSEKSYIPIINFSTAADETSIKIRNNVLSSLNKIIGNKLKLDVNIYTAISYLVSEMTDNNAEHSGENIGWLFAQYYPEDKFIDLCILDTGKTILGSYAQSGFNKIDNHANAIEQATKGVSTKAKERGYGIPTSRKIIVDGLKGRFGLVSGDAILQNEKITTIPAYWPGTFLTLRIPQKPLNFNIYEYIV